MKTNIKQYRKAKKREVDDQEQCRRLTLSPAVLVPNDILTEIFLRLPVRSLIQFKCVSKQWQSLISDQPFTPPSNFIPPRGLFLQKISTNVTVSTPTKYDFVPFDSIKTPPLKKLVFHENVLNSDVIILHSSNGLMLCYSLHVSKEGEFNATYYVYNPTTRQVATLPTRQDCDRIQIRPCGVILIFDPLKSSHYRVAFVRSYDYSKNIYAVEIYSSETRIWKILYPILRDDDFETEFMCGVYWNGSIHWINKRGRILRLQIDGKASFYQFQTPVIIDQWNIKRHCYPLVESRDRLMFMGISSAVDMRFDVHEVDKGYSGWTLKYRVDLNQVMFRVLDPWHWHWRRWFFKTRPMASMHEYVCKVTKGKVYDAKYYVYNPTINEVVTLPIIKCCDLAQRRPLGMSLVFDPLKSGFFKVRFMIRKLGYGRCVEMPLVVRLRQSLCVGCIGMMRFIGLIRKALCTNHGYGLHRSMSVRLLANLFGPVHSIVSAPCNLQCTITHD
ncbi:F-box protein [Artemisia annua]|uniref:F-box protein n=1 Tax=Artemisia annua TaxID=35608 RepID=A0A2U1LSW5_ARTAN|nr:F-box protein [Artemisia annua]